MAKNNIRLFAGKLFDCVGERIRKNVVVEVKDGIIQEITEGALAPKGADMDLKELTVLPSFIDCHTHMSFSQYRGPIRPQQERPLAERMAIAVPILDARLSAGIGTSRIAGERERMSAMLKRLVKEGVVRGPDILEAGLALRSSAGHGVVATPVDGVEAVRKAVRENFKLGADFTKIFLTGDPSTHTDVFTSFYSKDEIRAAIDEAHHLGMSVTAHAFGGLGLDWGLDCGLDSVDHGDCATVVQLEKMAKQKVSLVLTLAMIFNDELMQIGHAGEDELLAHKQKTKKPYSEIILKAREIGVLMAIGGDDASPRSFTGDVQEVVKIGLSPKEAILMATRNGAEVCGISKSSGTIEKGKVANLIGIKGDPLEDITAIDKVEFVMQRGKVVKQNGVMSEFLTQKMDLEMTSY